MRLVDEARQLADDIAHRDPTVADTLRELADTVARLSTDADGEPVTPGATLYLIPERSGATRDDAMLLSVPAAIRYCWYGTLGAAARAAGLPDEGVAR